MPKPRVFIAYTGGTIGMKKSPEGFIPVPGYLAQRKEAMPEFQREEMPDYTIHEYEPLLDSSNMSPVEWGKIAADIVAHYDDYDGFIIIHGTPAEDGKIQGYLEMMGIPHSACGVLSMVVAVYLSVGK